MELRSVSPRDIKVPDIRVTAEFDPELLAQFKESIKEVGQITPPIIYQVDGELILCDGLHRIQEAIETGEDKINVVVIPGDMVDVLTKNIFLDHLRGRTPPSQMVKVIGALYQEHGLDPDQIRAKTGLTRAYIEKLIRIAQASPEVVMALDKGVITVGHAFEISRLPYYVQQEEVMAKQSVWRWPVKELKDLVDQTLSIINNTSTEPPAAGPTELPPPRTYGCEGCKTETDPRFLRPVMLCPECFGQVWRLSKLAAPGNVKDPRD